MYCKKGTYYNKLDNKCSSCKTNQYGFFSNKKNDYICKDCPENSSCDGTDLLECEKGYIK